MARAGSVTEMICGKCRISFRDVLWHVQDQFNGTHAVNGMLY